jgi:hypothetical protein
MRKVLQNGMSFANERVNPCGVFARPLLLYAFFMRGNFIGLSKTFLGDFFYAKIQKIDAF